MEIDRLSPVPLYQQLANALRERLRAGEWRPREQLPSEAELSAESGLSRPTVRQAVKVLSDEGLVVSIPGRGTFAK